MPSIRNNLILLVLLVFLLIVLAFPEFKDSSDSGSANIAYNQLWEVNFNRKNEPIAQEAISPLPTELTLDERKVKLGRLLFQDPILSSNNSISCASCHNLQLGGSDNLQFPVGVLGQRGRINTPSIFNSAFNFRQFWDGRAESLEDQIGDPIQNSEEMNSKWSDVIKKVAQHGTYSSQFGTIYSDGVTEQNIKDAIATFERSLFTPNSPFDRYLRGEQTAISDDTKEGFRRFKNYGCISCHQGMNVGGNMFQRFGVMGDYFADRGNVEKRDYGRFNITGKGPDRYFFKVPSLRNVALNAPYFHDGSARTLDVAVAVMGRYQLGRQLSNEDIRLLILFLNSLTGENPEKRQR